MIITVAVLTVSVLAAAGYGLLMAPWSRVFGYYPHRGRTSDRIIALTFDDGPNEPYTTQIAQALHDRNIRATFFQVGRCVQQCPAVTVRLQSAGHVIGNHSHSHRFSTYLRPGRFREELAHSQEVLTNLLGRTPALARTPWLWRTPGVLRDLRDNALQPVGGVFAHAAEVFQPDAARIARRAVAKARPGAILIFHDGFDARGGPRGQTVRAVELTVDALLEQGFRFVTVDELLGVDAYHNSDPRPEPAAN